MMLRFADVETRSTRRTAGLLVVALVLAGIAGWRFSRGDTGKQSMKVVCAACGHEGQAEVGDTPGLELWPRPCPKCGENALYLGHRCRHCGRLVPMKDPNAEKYGTPERCPWCKTVHRES